MEDTDASGALERAFAKRGISSQLGAKATRVEETAEACRLTTRARTAPARSTADLMLVATGRGANVEGIGLRDAGVEFDRRKGITTDRCARTCRTSTPSGDVAGRWQLAHTAFREGEVAAENALGHESEVTSADPRCIYTDPEVAAVGLTEARRASATATTSSSAGARTRPSPARPCTATAPAS